jgi:hypothetical protein
MVRGRLPGKPIKDQPEHPTFIIHFSWRQNPLIRIATLKHFNNLFKHFDAPTSYLRFALFKSKTPPLISRSGVCVFRSFFTRNLACRVVALAKTGTLNLSLIMAPSGFGLSYYYRIPFLTKRLFHRQANRERVLLLEGLRPKGNAKQAFILD